MLVSLFVAFERGSTEEIAEGPVHVVDGPSVAIDSDSTFSLAKTPINLAALKKELLNYSDKKVAEEIATSFEFGFPLHYNGPRTPREFKNLKSASVHPEIVQQNLQ